MKNHDAAPTINTETGKQDKKDKKVLTEDVFEVTKQTITEALPDKFKEYQRAVMSGNEALKQFKERVEGSEIYEDQLMAELLAEKGDGEILTYRLLPTGAAEVVAEKGDGEIISSADFADFQKRLTDEYKNYAAKSDEFYKSEAKDVIFDDPEEDYADKVDQFINKYPETRQLQMLADNASEARKAGKKELAQDIEDKIVDKAHEFLDKIHERNAESGSDFEEFQAEVAISRIIDSIEDPEYEDAEADEGKSTSEEEESNHESFDENSLEEFLSSLGVDVAEYSGESEENQKNDKDNSDEEKEQKVGKVRAFFSNIGRKMIESRKKRKALKESAPESEESSNEPDEESVTESEKESTKESDEERLAGFTTATRPRKNRIRVYQHLQPAGFTAEVIEIEEMNKVDIADVEQQLNYLADESKYFSEYDNVKINSVIRRFNDLAREMKKFKDQEGHAEEEKKTYERSEKLAGEIAQELRKLEQ